ncbi:MAG TPA: aminopeptidase [Candidatus Binatia bacterium]|jgi:predicted aminopeptidase
MKTLRKFCRNLGGGVCRFVTLPHRCLGGRIKQLVALGVTGLFVGASLPGCSPVYVFRAAYEEGKILWRREPIADYLENPAVAQDTQEKLRLVLATRDYARDVLKFNVGGSYSSYSYVDRPDLTYIVMAAPKTELRPYTWWFLIVGSVPYKGYFSKEEAQAEIEKLKAEGYDTNLRTSAAFSTLGWFDDPLLSHLLRYDKVLLSEIVFHELFHNTLYLKGASAFNESSANFVGHRAAIDFFRDRFGEGSAEHQRALSLWDDEREFGAYIAEIARTLSELYGRDISIEEKLRLREEVFARSKAEWDQRIADRPNHRFHRFSQQPLNNAVLMHYVVYLKDLDLFESIYEACSRNLVRTVETLRNAVKKGGEPFEAVQAWLDKHRKDHVAATR